jgi:hypothetical protein
VGKLALTREVERHRLDPLRLVGVLAEMAAAAGIVDEDVDRSEAGERLGRDLLRRVVGHEILLD